MSTTPTTVAMKWKKSSCGLRNIFDWILIIAMETIVLFLYGITYAVADGQRDIVDDMASRWAEQRSVKGNDMEPEFLRAAEVRR